MRLSISFKPVNIFLAKRHFICPEKLIEKGKKPLCRVSEVYRILSFKLTYNLFSKYIVKRGKLIAAAAYVYGYIRFYLLHNSVTERYVEMLYKVLIKLVESFLVSAADFMLLNRLFYNIAELLCRNVHLFR